MNTYIDQLQKFYKQLSIWNDTPDINVFGDDDSACRNFVSKYFEEYKKKYQNKLLCFDTLYNIELGRYRYIVNTFLLGIAIYNDSDFIRKRISDELALYDNGLRNLTNKKDKFEFVWFLICLFHDLAYPMENKGNDCEIACYQDLKERFTSFLLEELIGVPLLYQGMVSRYFDYKRMMYRKPECDHGIYAGLYMYNYLCKNRVMQRTKKGNAGLWNPALDRVYKFAASIVTCHNIWLQPKQEDVPKYIHCGMQSLMVPRGSRPIRICDYPIFFLFCLVDSMEVAKRKKFALEKLKMSISDNEIKFDIGNFCEVDRYALRNHFFAINDWLTDVRETENGVVTISIK